MLFCAYRVHCFTVHRPITSERQSQFKWHGPGVQPEIHYGGRLFRESGGGAAGGWGQRSKILHLFAKLT